MVTIEDVVKKMNELLHNDLPDDMRIKEALDTLKSKFRHVIRFLDLEYYNETTLQWAKQGKVEAVKSKNFELAAEFRDIEKKCQEYVTVRNAYHIDQSAFFCENGALLYLYFGTARNDKAFKHRLDSHFHRLVKDRFC